MLSMLPVSLCKIAAWEPSPGEQAPGDSKFRHRPLLDDDVFACHTQQRGFVTKSYGQEELTGRALLKGDGPASPAPHQGRPRRSSVPSGNSVKGRTARVNKRIIGLSGPTNKKRSRPFPWCRWPRESWPPATCWLTARSLVRPLR